MYDWKGEKKGSWFEDNVPVRTGLASVVTW